MIAFGAVLEIALNTTSLQLFTNIAGQKSTFVAYLSFNSFVIVIRIPDFRCPIHTNDVCPLIFITRNWFHDSFQLRTHTALDFITGFSRVFYQLCTSTAIPGLVFVGQPVFDISAVARLMCARVTQIANYNFIEFKILAILTNVAFNIILMGCVLYLVIGVVFVD